MPGSLVKVGDIRSTQAGVEVSLFGEVVGLRGRGGAGALGCTCSKHEESGGQNFERINS